MSWRAERGPLDDIPVEGHRRLAEENRREGAAGPAAARPAAGYRIAQAVKRVTSAEPLDPAALRSIWDSVKSSRERGPAVLYAKLGERILNVGEPLPAYDVIHFALKGQRECRSASGTRVGKVPGAPPGHNRMKPSFPGALPQAISFLPFRQIGRGSLVTRP